MAEEHTNKAPECESNIGGEGAVETKDRGLFNFFGKKEEKPQEEVIATEFEKVKIEETKVQEEQKKEGEEKNHSLLEKLHRSDSSSSSVSTLTFFYVVNDNLALKAVQTSVFILYFNYHI